MLANSPLLRVTAPIHRGDEKHLVNVLENRTNPPRVGMRRRYRGRYAPARDHDGQVGNGARSWEVNVPLTRGSRPDALN
jgi:hypothetical protein